jgi:hypothetical protein
MRIFLLKLKNSPKFKKKRLSGEMYLPMLQNFQNIGSSLKNTMISCRYAHVDDAGELKFCVHHPAILCTSSKFYVSHFNWYRWRKLFRKGPKPNKKYNINIEEHYVIVLEEWAIKNILIGTIMLTLSITGCKEAPCRSKSSTIIVFVHPINTSRRFKLPYKL